jgi:hypothetical protein
VLAPASSGCAPERSHRTISPGPLQSTQARWLDAAEPTAPGLLRAHMFTRAPLSRAPPTQQGYSPAAAMSRCCPCATSSPSAPLFLLPSVPAASGARGSSVAFSPCGSAFTSAASGTLRGGVRPRRGRVTIAASSKDGNGTERGQEKEDESPAFNPFGFVTDNPSSRSAIQLPAVPAEDGNVGQMLYVMLQASLHLPVLDPFH